MSKYYPTAEKWYLQGNWNDTQMETLVSRNLITQAEYDELKSRKNACK